MIAAALTEPLLSMVLPIRDVEKGRAVLNLLTDRDVDGLHHAAGGRTNRVVHFHRFEDAEPSVPA